jgi:hypothetical protein
MRKFVTAFAICAALGMSTVASADLVDSASSSPDVFYGDSGAIPPGPAVVTDSIVVAGSPVTSITELTVTVAIDHLWVGDNQPIVLSKMGGPSIILVSKPGAVGLAPFGDSSDLCSGFPITYADTALAASESMGVVPPIGNLCIGDPANGSASSYLASDDAGVVTSLNATFAGVDFNGTWELSITDTFPGGTGGTLTDWTINVVGVPEPSTVALLGLGVLALIKRRRS